MSKWAKGTRFFEFSVDKKGVVEELIADGDIETLCGSNTQRSYCIATDGCAPTIAALKPFAPDMFEDNEIAWWLLEISEEDANAFYAMDELCGKISVFTKEDNERVQKLADGGDPPVFALFLVHQYASPVTLASGLTLKDAYALCRKTVPAEGALFIANEQGFHNARKRATAVLFMYDGAAKTKWVFSGPLDAVMPQIKEHFPHRNEVRLVDFHHQFD